MKNLSLSLVVLVVAALLFFSLTTVNASHDPNLEGWGWSENIGWVSFNYKNCDTDGDGFSNGGSGCPAQGSVVGDYGVNMNIDTYALSGYAWSEHVGWLSFQPSDVSGCPIGPCNPTVNPNTGNLSGWAKFLNGSSSSGWDGWMSLSGNTGVGGTYGVHFDFSTGNFDGCTSGSCAWGDVVVGWFDWGDVFYNGSPTPPDEPEDDQPQEFELRTGITGSSSIGTITGIPNQSPCVNRLTCISVHETDPNDPLLISLSFTRENGTRFVSWVNNAGNPSSVCDDSNITICEFNLVSNTTVRAKIRLSACNDGLDNDNDGFVDLADPGCTDIDDDDESGDNEPQAPQCSDGVDNEDTEDTLADIADPGCHTDGNPDSNGDGEPDNLDGSYDPNKTSEDDFPTFKCSDGIDNDNDGTCDFAGCTINGVFKPADPSCGGNPFSDGEGRADVIDEI